MKKIALLFLVTILSLNLSAQKLYDETANGEKQLTEALEKAKKEGKHVLIQMGGNWCKWCLRFNEFVNNNPEIKKVADENYVVLHLNFDKKDKEMKTELAIEIEKLLAQMTIEEKVAQTAQIAYTQISKEKAEEYARKGIGSFLHVLGEDAKRLQEIAVSNGKKIPILFWYSYSCTFVAYNVSVCIAGLHFHSENIWSGDKIF